MDYTIALFNIVRENRTVLSLIWLHKNIPEELSASEV